MLRYLVFADCATLFPDGESHLRDVFTGMAYGLFPFCVQPNRTGTHIFFRRISGPGESRERQRRMTEATDALATLPALRRYNESLPDANLEIHVEDNCTVSWPVGASREEHLEVIPELLRWTNWEVPAEEPWRVLRQQVADSDARGPTSYVDQSRHLRLSLVLDHVGCTAAESGFTTQKQAAVVRRAMQRYALGTLEVLIDEATGGIREIREAAERSTALWLSAAEVSSANEAPSAEPERDLVQF
jgi:hypothetical protein